MNHNQIRIFLSDFEIRDDCVGTFKGDIKSGERNIEIVDITYKT